MTPEQLLQIIRQRKSLERFGRGIITADRYVKTIQDVIGMHRCYQYMAKGGTSFDDLLKKAANTLVYSNDEMELEEIYNKQADGSLPKLDLPKNTLMVFRHCLTSSKKDRDGDILHSDGAIVDPKMLLLWQHVHTLPIGKMLKVSTQNPKRLEVFSCIVDMNDLSHDAAVMIDNKMGRFSHGFRALKFTENKEGSEGISSGDGSGFNITSFEVMEESLVSVPANPDAEVDEILLSLVEGNKLTSSIMKEFGKGIRERKNLTIPSVTVKVFVNGEEKTNENESRIGSEAAGGVGQKTGQSSTSKEADEGDDEESEGSSESEVKSSQHSESETLVSTEIAETPVENKSGRILSKSNEALIQKAKDHVDDVAANSDKLSRGHGAQLREASGHLSTVLKTVSQDQIEEGSHKPTMFTVETAAAHILANANPTQRKHLLEILKSMEVVAQREAVADQYGSLVKAKPPKTPEGDDGDNDEDDQGSGPEKYDGDLHNDTHKENQKLSGKEAHAFLVKCGLKCTETTKDGVKCDNTPKQVSALLTKSGFAHKYFTEDGDKRVDSYHIKETKDVEWRGMKATSMHFVKEKGVSVITVSRSKDTD